MANFTVIYDAVMPGLNERLKFLKAKVPGVVDMTLGKFTAGAAVQSAIAPSTLQRTLVKASHPPRDTGIEARYLRA